MRSRRVLVALLLASCTTEVAPERIDGAELCRRLTDAIGSGADLCCAAAGRSETVTALIDECTTQLEPLLDDPRVGIDAAAANAFLDELDRRSHACDGAWAAWALGPDGIRSVVRGTRAVGTDCSSTDPRDAASLLSCIDSYCPFVSSGARTCTAFVVEGGACTNLFECQPGLFCTARGDGTGDVGACRRPQAVGASCRTSGECASGLCTSNACAMPSATHPETICFATPPPPTDRDVDLQLSGFDVSSTRTATLRLLDASDAQVVVYEMIGIDAASSAHHVPRAVPSGTATTAQFWTSDPSSPTPERRSWEVPVAADGAIAIAIGWDDAQTPITRMPPPSMDTLFELALFDFDPELGKTFDLRLVLDSTQRTVGQIRVAAIPDIMFMIDLPDTVTPAARYRFAMYVDENGDDAYEAPPVDHAWTALATAPPTGGLSLPYAWSSSYQDVHY